MSRIAVTGSTGLIGEALIASLLADDHTIHRVVRDRSKAGPDDIVWDLASRTIDTEKLEGVDAVVHLAGAPIGDARWTDEVKRRIRESRVVGTALMAETLAGLQDKPSVFVSASGANYYGDRGDEVLTESAAPGDDFLARVCLAWEEAAQPAVEAGIRTVHPRSGAVLAEHGPLMDKVDLPFKLGVGGKIGSGRQYVPWISLVDEVRGLRFLIDNDLHGGVNMVGPEPATNKELTGALGEAMRRPTVVPIPVFALRLLYGEMGETLAAASIRATPKALLDAGFTFTHTDIRSAMRVALTKRAAA